MSYSVRFYFDKDKANQKTDAIGDITNSAKNLGKFVEPNYYEFKTEHHLLAHPEEFIPFEFQQLIRPFTTKITLVTENLSYFGMRAGRGSSESFNYSRSSRVPAQIGSSRISFDDDSVMIVGKKLDLMIKAYLLFCKYDGYMPDFKEEKDEQRIQELRGKWVASLSKNKELEEKLRKLTPKTPFWKFW